MIVKCMLVIFLYQFAFFSDEYDIISDFDDYSVEASQAEENSESEEPAFQGLTVDEEMIVSLGEGEDFEVD